MPGYYVHLSACAPEAIKASEDFRIGIEIPDLLKTYYWESNKDLEKVEKLYNALKTSNMPNFSFFKQRVGEREEDSSCSGMHYGISSNPNIMRFLDEFTTEMQVSPFFRGYTWHLLIDAIIYTHLDIDSLWPEGVTKEESDRILSKLHSDWDRTNRLIREEYGVEIPKEIAELGIVNFIEGTPSCIDWNVIEKDIQLLRKYNPITMDFSAFKSLVIELLKNI